jgi:hypothetical protein
VTWFKVDDTLAAHSKTRKAGLPAMGLWVVAGSWSSQQLTEGFIPDWFVETWPRGKQYAANLVRAQLWFESNSGPERGYRFHDWTDCNPTAEQVKTERAAGAERQRRAREKAAQARAGSNRNGVTNAVTHAVSHGEVTADVTRESHRESRSPRPDPTRKELTTTAPRQRGCRIPDDFAVTDQMRDWATANGFGRLDLDQITDEFRDYWEAEAGPRAVKLDWVKTWHNRVREIAKRTTTRPTNGYAQPQPAPAPKILTLAQVRARNDAENLAACRRAAEIDGVAP